MTEDQWIHDAIANAQEIARSVRCSVGPDELVPPWAIAMEDLAKATAELARRQMPSAL